MRWEGTDLDEGLGRERQREEALVKMLQAGTQVSKENQGRSSNNAERKQDVCFLPWASCRKSSIKVSIGLDT